MRVRLPLVSLLFYLLLLLSDRSPVFPITLGAALLHELGHMTAAELCGVGITEIIVWPFGAEIRLDAPLRSYRRDFLIASAGAAFNAAAAGLLLLAPQGALREWSIAANLTLALTNLLPVEGLDGGGMLKSALCALASEEKADAVLRIFSFAGVFFMWLIAVYLFFVREGNPSLFLLSCALFFSVFIRGGQKGKTE